MTHRCRIREAAGGLISPSWCLDTYADVLLALPDGLAEADVLRPELRLFPADPNTAVGEGLELYYAPFELVNPGAKIVLVGITPGRHQMFEAIRAARAALLGGATGVEALDRASRTGSFAGRMRTNLVDMLDGIGLGTALGLDSAARLFDTHRGLLGSTSAIAHPVFLNGANYSGTRPPIDQHPLLRAFIRQVLAAQLAATPEALVIPLGAPAGTAVQLCVTEGAVRPEQCVLHFPHPSPGNGHRRRLYNEWREQMSHTVAAWFAQQ